MRILFIGNLLSKKKGTKGISEKLLVLLKRDDLKFLYASDKSSQILRFLEIIYKCLFSKYDIIHIDTFSGNAFRIAEAASILAQLKRTKIILTLRGGKLPEFYLQYPDRVKRAFYRADYLQTPSMYLKEFFNGQGFNVNYLPNSIDLSLFPYSRDKVRPHSLLWVRAFTEIYNPWLAIMALYEVRKLYPDTILTMIGPDKGLLAKTKKLVSDLGLDSAVIITGPVPNEQLYKYYHSHEVFLNTTSYESFGVAVLEAAACGIPVVSTKVGELPYIWKHEKDILFAEEMDPINFADKIKLLFGSIELKDILSKNARLKAENFAWDKIKHSWINLLTE